MGEDAFHHVGGRQGKEVGGGFLGRDCKDENEDLGRETSHL